VFKEAVFFLWIKSRPDPFPQQEMKLDPSTLLANLFSVFSSISRSYTKMADW